MRRILTTTLIDTVQAAQRYSEVTDLSNRQMREVPDTWEDDLLDHQRLWSLVSRLPARQRAIVVLRYYEDLSERQIAHTLGCRPGTVKSQASAALRRLSADVITHPVERAE